MKPGDQLQENKNQIYSQVFWQVNHLILKQIEYAKLPQEIVDLVFQLLNIEQMGYVMISILLVDPASNTLARIAVSENITQEPRVKDIKEYIKKVAISLSNESNLGVRVFKERKEYLSKSWANLLTPVVSIEAAGNMQKSLRVETIVLFPLSLVNECLGIIEFHLSRQQESTDQSEFFFLKGVSDTVSVALDNSRLNERLKELDKLKDEFLSIAAHELRTPLTAIKGYIWELMKCKKPPDRAKLYMERVYKSTDRLVNLVNDMLNVSRIESGTMQMKIENFEVSRVIADVLTDLAPKFAEKNLKVSFTPLGQKEFWVTGDPEKTAQVAINIIGNAIKFTPDAGQIVISAQVSNGFSQVNIADTGPGMDREDLAKLFGKFSRAKTGSNIIGTGLGLYISKQFIEKMGGRIWATSSGPGHGSVFSFTLPLTKR